MPANTPNGLPYPLPTEPVAEGATAMRSLAEAIDTPEPWHEVGGPGEPGFAWYWVNYGPPKSTAAFMKDRSGFVHIKGTVKSGNNGQPVFVLPDGYRPPSDERFVNNAWDGTAERLARIDVVASTGYVQVTVLALAGSIIYEAGIGGIVFRAGPLASTSRPAPETRPTLKPEPEPKSAGPDQTT